MADYVYYLEDPFGDVPPESKALLRFDTDSGELSVYRKQKQEWEEDNYYGKILYGSIEVDVISEEEAQELIRTVYRK